MVEILLLTQLCTVIISLIKKYTKCLKRSLLQEQVQDSVN